MLSTAFCYQNRLGRNKRILTHVKISALCYQNPVLYYQNFGEKCVVLITYEITMRLFSLAFVVIQCRVFIVTRSLILRIKMGKRNDLSLQEKKKSIEKYDALPNTSQREAASKLNISQPLLCKLLCD